MRCLRNFSYSLILLIYLLNACTTSDPGRDLAPSIPQETGVIQDEFEGESVLIYANSRLHLFVAYSRTSASGKVLDFHVSDKPFPVVFEDNEGTLWNVFGEAVSGPGDGDKLLPVIAQTGYWFSFSSFFPKVTLYNESLNERIIDEFNNNEWLINPADVKKASLKDGIPSIDDPQFDLVDLFDENNELYEEGELMIVINDNTGARVYPHTILNWHEVVNDTFDDENIVLSYCPLTGTGSVWESDVTGTLNPEFGVSGLLYNNNLILYDRNTESLWSQILGQSVNGDLIDNRVTYKNSITMSWRGVKELSMPTRVLTENTGFNRSYDIYPYGDYKTSSNLLFTPTYTDDRLHPKAWVLAIIINNRTKIYQFKDFSN